MDGKFIIVEGIDNVGKTAISIELAKKLDNAVYVKTPVEPHLSMCKEFDTYNNEKNLDKRFELFVKGMLYSSKIIKRYKKMGKTIIADRWIWTTFAYHFAKDNDLYEGWKDNWHSIESELIKPDASYLIVVSNTSEWIRRHKEKKLSVGDIQLMEDVKLRHRIIDFFMNLNPDFEVIDNSGKFENTAKEVIASLEKLEIR